METFFLTPQMFDHYIAFDPSLWWNNHYLVRTTKNIYLNFHQTKKKRVWFAWFKCKRHFAFHKRISKHLKKKKKLSSKMEIF